MLYFSQGISLFLLFFSFFGCATNTEKIKASDHKLKFLIGEPIYFLSHKYVDKYYLFFLKEDGTFESDINSFQNCYKWDLSDTYELFLECNKERIKLTADTVLEHTYSGVRWKLLDSKKPFSSLAWYDQVRLNSQELKIYEVTESQSWGVFEEFYKILEKENIGLRGVRPHSQLQEEIKTYIIIGEQNKQNFTHVSGNWKEQVKQNENRLLGGINPNDTIDLRDDENMKNFFLLNLNKIDYPENYFGFTPESERLNAIDFKKKLQDLYPLKSKKYIRAEFDYSYRLLDKKPSVALYIRPKTTYSGGFAIFDDPELILKLEANVYENFGHAKYFGVELIAEYDFDFKTEKAFISTKYNGILNEENFENYKINFREGLPYIQEKMIKFRQINLKVKNFRVFSINGESLWKH
ncbi:hypothetical protein CLV96_3895 [Leptospira meyeri]|uniref:Lipoprotein n=1 Tax=Leptospira meyeri TaxID=29508 RepID=A0A4R8MJY5_LEPME|nr:hypothetical protein [Leptospira meyeri]EKJ86177.1 hypothetical protein LEP1GSC017_0020 [Leptospira meyeri serovar Hardjo str. Went 5]TDY66516.1 hypothetical protein CLV96_3895 [Leptospira meyeri]